MSWPFLLEKREMTELAQLVSEDSRSPIQKLRRCQLWKIADRHGLQYPAAAPKTTMIKLLEAHGVDITRPLDGVEWQTLYPSAEAQQAAALNGQSLTPQVVPVTRIHASARNGVSAQLMIGARAAAQEKVKEDKFKESRIAALERDNVRMAEENARLKEIIEQRLAALESKPPVAPEVPETVTPPSSQRDYWKLYREAKALGLPVEKGMRREAIEAMIREKRSV
jgi:hypothetical protein